MDDRTKRRQMGDEAAGEPGGRPGSICLTQGSYFGS